MARILLIETDRPLANNLCQFLSGAGHEVDWHVNPQDAMDSADKQSPDAIVLDLLLAGRSGIEFLYELRSYPDWQTLPVIIFSSLSPRELSSASDSLHQLNIAAYHYKPSTTLAELARSIDHSLQPVSA
jgi:DNA-binding response OmpR family regulator